MTTIIWLFHDIWGIGKRIFSWHRVLNVCSWPRRYSGSVNVCRIFIAASEPRSDALYKTFWSILRFLTRRALTFYCFRHLNSSENNIFFRDTAGTFVWAFAVIRRLARAAFLWWNVDDGVAVLWSYQSISRELCWHDWRWNPTRFNPLIWR